MKRLIWISGSLAFVFAGAVFMLAQNAADSRPLKEYANVPAIKPVDSVFMEDMTWLEIKNAMKAGKTTVIVPAGGLEATGPFITLNKHQNMLRGQTDMIARKLGNALIAPEIKYVPPDDGQRGPYLGDFNISLAAYKSTLEDICTALKTDGFKEIVLIGDHQGAQRGMKEAAEELDPKWEGAPTKVHYIPEYYDRTAVNNYVKNELHITDKQRTRFGDNYYNTAILFAVNPEGARLKERTEAGQLSVQGIDLRPVEKTIVNGKKILDMQTDQTVKAIQKAIAGV